MIRSRGTGIPMAGTTRLTLQTRAGRAGGRIWRFLLGLELLLLFWGPELGALLAGVGTTGATVGTVGTRSVFDETHSSLVSPNGGGWRAGLRLAQGAQTCRGSEADRHRRPNSRVWLADWNGQSAVLLATDCTRTDLISVRIASRGFVLTWISCSEWSWSTVL